MRLLTAANANRPASEADAKAVAEAGAFAAGVLALGGMDLLAPAGAGRDVLLYVHGFNQTFETAALDACCSREIVIA